MNIPDPQSKNADPDWNANVSRTGIVSRTKRTPISVTAEQKARTRRLNEGLIAVVATLSVVGYGLYSEWPGIAYIMALAGLAFVAFAYITIQLIYRMGDTGTAPAPQGPPAGWYHDPQGVIRWHDGTQWTDVLYPNPNQNL